MGLVHVPDVYVGRIAGERRAYRVADLVEESLDLPGISADVVLAEYVEDVFPVRFLGAGSDDAFHNLVVGDVVAGRLADPLIALAVVMDHRNTVPLLRRFCNGGQIVADESDRTRRADVDGPRVEDRHDLVDHLRKFLLAPKDDVALLHVGREAHRRVDLLGRSFLVDPCFVPPCPPAVVRAPDRAVGDREHILDRSDDHALASGVAASALRYDPGNRPGICLDLRAGAGGYILFDDVFFPVLFYFVRHRCQYIVDVYVRHRHVFCLL